MLYHISILEKNLPNLIRHLTVNFKPGFYKDGLGTQPNGPCGRHGRVDTEFANLITGSCYYAAPVRRSPDYKWFSPIFGKVPLLNRGIEGIHIDMDYFTDAIFSHAKTSLIKGC